MHNENCDSIFSDQFQRDHPNIEFEWVLNRKENKLDQKEINNSILYISDLENEKGSKYYCTFDCYYLKRMPFNHRGLQLFHHEFLQIINPILELKKSSIKEFRKLGFIFV